MINLGNKQYCITNNKMSEPVKETFQYKMNNNYITFEYIMNDAKCWMHSYYIDFERIPEFFILLKEAIEKLKQKNIEIYEQDVSVDEWNEYLKSNELWTFERPNLNNTYTISCKIDYTPICIAKGFGLDEK